MKEGDQNTRYFHSRATHRQHRNQLIGIQSEEGDLLTQQPDIGARFVDYFM